MLWQTEKNSDVYIDLIKNIACDRRNYRLHRKKNNELSTRIRMEGNNKYNRSDFKGAMSKYNESICLAGDSEMLSLSYANRSQCFMKLSSYDRCLNDIRLAKEAGYPVHLMPKLESRQSECIKQLESKSVTPPSTTALTINPHYRLSEMTDGIKIDTDILYGRYVKATRDIQIGETLVVEDAFIRTVNDDGSNDCTTCGKTKTNFIPCENCADAMFCNKVCRDNHFHEYECDIVFGSIDEMDWLAFTLRSVIVGINSFATVEDMMDFVKNCLSTDRFEVPESCNSCLSKYRTFFKLTCSQSHRMISESHKLAYFVFHAIMNSAKLAPKFEQIAKQHFLVHLIIHHYIILRKNAFGFEKDDVHELSLLASHFNHSCLPNVAKLSKDNVSVCKTILPIKRNEQLFLTYIAEEIFDMSEKQRNDRLQIFYEFRCKCELCKYGTLKVQNLENDPCFVYVVANVKTNDFNVNIVKGIIQHCVAFLVQHSDMRRSQEFHYIADILTAMYSKEISE